MYRACASCVWRPGFVGRIACDLACARSSSYNLTIDIQAGSCGHTPYSRPPRARVEGEGCSRSTRAEASAARLTHPTASTFLISRAGALDERISPHHLLNYVRANPSELTPFYPRRWGGQFL